MVKLYVSCTVKWYPNKVITWRKLPQYVISFRVQRSNARTYHNYTASAWSQYLKLTLPCSVDSAVKSTKTRLISYCWIVTNWTSAVSLWNELYITLVKDFKTTAVQFTCDITYKTHSYFRSCESQTWDVLIVSWLTLSSIRNISIKLMSMRLISDFWALNDTA